MEIITGTTDFYLEKETAVAIGKFDGVHIGHRRLLEEILCRRSREVAACVFTFDPAPAVLFGQSDGKELTVREEKRKLLERMGVDILIEFPLTPENAAISPEAFITDVLVKRMNAVFIAAGRDLSFGAGGAGNAELLKQLEGDMGYELELIDKVCFQGREVSSSYIRSLVEAGSMELAEQLLGVPYTISGQVVYGNRIGRTLGFPTVNLLPPENKLLPPKGVYDSRVRCLGQQYRAITNVGYKPTVSDEKVMGVESYLYDFDKEVYGEPIEVSLLSFRRPEQRFENLEALKRRLKEDIESGSSNIDSSQNGK